MPDTAALDSSAPARSESTRREQRRARSVKPRRRVSVLGVFGELLLTAGAVLMLFVGWQLWIGDMIVGAQQREVATALSDQWQDAGEPDAVEPPAEPAQPDAQIVPVAQRPADGSDFGVMYVPRFGAEWFFPITAGTDRRSILDHGRIGLYDDAAMPGQDGNMSVAAHRWTGGAAFDPVDKLVIGDAIVVETAEGWYTYRFRNVEYVQDTQVEVLAPVPQRVDLAANGKYLTLTSCAPKLNMLERIISYAVFDEFTPRAEGTPAALTEGVNA